MKRFFHYIIYVLLGLVFTSCDNTDYILHRIEDLEGSHIAVLDHSISDQDFETLCPESKIAHFKSSSEFLLAIAIGKCDAGIVRKVEGMSLLSRNDDYQLLRFPELQSDTTIVITHNRMLPGRNLKADRSHVIDKSWNRIYRSIISDGYWLLILKGFLATVSMFLLGILIAFSIAILILGMNTNRYLRFISGPIEYFIRYIHDVPSIVLIFFFYYVVFASAHISGIIICSISLGVYTSGSLLNVFKVHLNQIDRNQHAAAQMLGLTGWKKYRYVILPQAVKPMLPLLGAESKVLLRATTYAGYISELDLVKVTEIIRNQTYDVLVPLILVSAIFLLLSRIIVESLSVIYTKAFKYD